MITDQAIAAMLSAGSAKSTAIIGALSSRPATIDIGSDHERRNTGPATQSRCSRPSTSTTHP